MHIDLEISGPSARLWPNYGALPGKKYEDKRHCHLEKVNPTYVACWRVFKKERLIEVYYAGSHEKAPY